MDNKSKLAKNLTVQGIRIGLIEAVVWANTMKSNGIIHDVTQRIDSDDQSVWSETIPADLDQLH